MHEAYLKAPLQRPDDHTKDYVNLGSAWPSGFPSLTTSIMDPSTVAWRSDTLLPDGWLLNKRPSQGSEARIFIYQFRVYGSRSPVSFVYSSNITLDFHKTLIY